MSKKKKKIVLFQKIQCWWTRAHKTYSKIPLLFPVKAYQGQQCNDSTASTNNTKIEIFFVYVVKLIYAFLQWMIEGIV